MKIQSMISILVLFVLLTPSTLAFTAELSYYTGKFVSDQIFDPSNKEHIKEIEESIEEYQSKNGELGDSQAGAKDVVLEEHKLALQEKIGKLWSLIINTFLLVIDMIVLSALVFEMILLISFFTKWLPLIFKRITESLAVMLVPGGKK